VVTALVAVVAVGLALWGLMVRTSADDPHRRPQAEPTVPGASTVSHVVPIGPPPWVRYSTPLEGRWVSEAGPGRITLVVSNASFDVLREVGQRQGFPATHRLMVLLGDRVILRIPGGPQVTAYRWRVDGDQLTFELLGTSPETGLRLGGRTFVSAR
jgi:hypothetical protein